MPHPNLADKVVAASVLAATNDYTFQFQGEPGDTTATETILLCAQNGAAITGTVTAGDDGSTYGTTVGTFTAVKAITVTGGILHDYIKVAVSGQPALSIIRFNDRAVTSTAQRHFQV